MSRLADILTGMDRSWASRAPIGGIPDLAGHPAAPRRWRVGATLVILLGMAALVAAVCLHPQSVAPTAPPPAAPVVTPGSPPAPIASRAGPEPTADLVRQGLAAAHAGAVVEASTLFRRALDADSTDAETWNNLGVVLVRQGDWTAGTDAFRRAIRLRPRHADAHRNLAIALDGRHQTAEAITHYRAFLDESPRAHPGWEAIRLRVAELTGSPSGHPPAARRQR